jgi:hypothetical protein
MYHYFNHQSNAVSVYKLCKSSFYGAPCSKIFICLIWDRGTEMVGVFQLVNEMGSCVTFVDAFSSVFILALSSSS